MSHSMQPFSVNVFSQRSNVSSEACGQTNAKMRSRTAGGTFAKVCRDTGGVWNANWGELRAMSWVPTDCDFFFFLNHFMMDSFASLAISLEW